MNYKEFLELLLSFFSTNDNLKYVDSVTVSKDFNDIINDSFPVINIEPSGFQFEKHPELTYKGYQKETYKIYFSLGTQNESYTTSVIGNNRIKGIVDLIFDFKLALKDFENEYRYTTMTPTIKLNRDKLVLAQRTLKLNESGKFLSTAECEVEFYITVKL